MNTNEERIEVLESAIKIMTEVLETAEKSMIIKSVLMEKKDILMSKSLRLDAKMIESALKHKDACMDYLMQR